MTDRIDKADIRGDQGGGAAQRGYGEGGYTPFGQMVEGSSNQAAGGYGGDNVGGYGQQVQNSQSGQGGMGPMTQGAGYGQGGSQFGRAGQDSSSGANTFNAGQGSGQDSGQRQSQGGFGQTQSQGGFDQGSSASQYGASKARDHHEPHYRQWRDTQLAAHDRDYARWRDEQARKYDEDYHGWRSERHSAFSKAFETWRGGSADTSATTGRQPDVAREAVVDPNAVHGANPMLADIADGHAGAHHNRRPEDDNSVDSQG